MSQGPRTEAGKRLLEQEAYNSRSFPLITLEAILAIEAEARADVDGLVARIAELENALEQERNNRKDQVRRKRVGQATTRTLLEAQRGDG